MNDVHETRDHPDPSSPDPSPTPSPLAPMLAEARAKGLWFRSLYQPKGHDWFGPDEFERLVTAPPWSFGSIDDWFMVDPAPEIERRRSVRVRDAAEGLLAACKWARSRCGHCDGSGQIDVREYDSASGRMEITGRTDPCPACGPLRAAIAAAEPAEGEHLG